MKPNNRPRDEEIVRRREAGESFRSIAQDVGIGAGRVAQIYEQQKRIEKWEARGLWNDSISVRAYNTLRTIGVADDDDPRVAGERFFAVLQKWADDPNARPSLLRNCGQKTIDEIVQALRNGGFSQPLPVRIATQVSPVTMPCGWGCGANLRSSQLVNHFAHCPNRPPQRS